MVILQEKFHIIGMSKVIGKLLKSCLVCIRLNGNPLSPVMAPLPSARVNPVPRPFYCTGIDFFGPFSVSQGRRQIKTYGVLFTCLTSRAVHFELAYSLDISSFIAAFRRFEARRGTPKTVYSDQGTNLVGAWKVMQKELCQLEKESISQYASQHGIEWVFSPPRGSHYGGAWERLIRSTRRIILAVACDTKRGLSVEELTTLLCEAEFILNSRPLTPVSAESLEMGPITPNHILLGSSCPATIISGDVSSHQYSRQRWKLVQSLADQFWKRWRKEYIPTLRLRPKWHQNRRNFEVGDMVLVIDGDCPRGSWPNALIENTYPSKDGVVRKVSVRLVRQCKTRLRDLPGVTILERPVNKLILISSWRDLSNDQ